MSTPGFWRKLYQRCTYLPVELQDPAILNHSRGLRATVIRALRIRYSYKLKDVGDASNNELVKSLVGTLCVDQDWDAVIALNSRRPLTSKCFLMMKMIPEPMIGMRCGP